MPELPYVPFYCSDWLGDTKVRLMTLEERAIHFDLLCHSWQAPLPADHGDLARLLGVPARKLESAWKRVGQCWQSNGNGGIENPRLEKERAKQKAKRKAGGTGAGGSSDG